LTAILSNGLAFQKALRSDGDFVLAAVKEHKYALRYADDSLKNNSEFMKEVEQYL